jgi:hypothetical protein
MYLLYALLHECPAEAPAEWDPEVALSSLRRALRKKFGVRVDLRDLLLSVKRDEPPFYFPAQSTWPIAECMNVVPDDPWEGALRLALSLVARPMHLCGERAFDTIAPQQDQLLHTPSEKLIRDICHEIPETLTREYSATIGTGCVGYGTAETRAFARLSLVALYEAFRASYYPPFTRAFAVDFRGYVCFDLREAAFRRECEQGNPSSPYGSVAITFAMARA